MCLCRREELGSLKAQCGGLQTLLRNARRRFVVQAGVVRIALPPSLAAPLPDSPAPCPSPNPSPLPCWLHSHHPQGCPNPGPQCIFSHE